MPESVSQGIHDVDVRLALELATTALRYLDPDAASLVPSLGGDDDGDGDSDSEELASIPVDEWPVLHASTDTHSTTAWPPAASTHVRSHPSPSSHLFAVQSVIPGVDARQFWALMAHAPNRSLWDRTVEHAEVQRSYATESHEQDELARSMACRVEVLRFSSIFLVAKARDMVLLSVDARLPGDTLRLVSVSQSVTSDAHPPRKGYSRFQLNLGGFLVEDLRPPASASSAPAIKVTQLSDLGDVAAWVPQSVVRMVASTMVPRGIANIARVAKQMRVPRAIQGDVAARASSWDREEKLGGAGGTWPEGRALPPIISQLAGLLPKEHPKAEPALGTPLAQKTASNVATPSPYAAVLSPTRKAALRNASAVSFDPLAAYPSRPPRGPLRDSVGCFDSGSEGEEDEGQSTATPISELKRRRLLSSSGSMPSSSAQLRRISVAILEPQEGRGNLAAGDDGADAMMLASSDAIAMALAPGARESVVFADGHDEEEEEARPASAKLAPRLAPHSASRTSRSSSSATSISTRSSPSIAASSLMPWALTRAHRKASDASSVSVAESFEVAEGVTSMGVGGQSEIPSSASQAVSSLVAASGRPEPYPPNSSRLLGVPYAVALWLVSSSPSTAPQHA